MAHYNEATCVGNNGVPVGCSVAKDCDLYHNGDYCCRELS